MQLELATYPVDSVDLDVFAGALAFDDPRLASVDVDVVRPGDSVRLTHVLDAVEPRVKAEAPEATFPGALGALRPAGQGRTNRIAGRGRDRVRRFPGSRSGRCTSRRLWSTWRVPAPSTRCSGGRRTSC